MTLRTDPDNLKRKATEQVYKISKPATSVSEVNCKLFYRTFEGLHTALGHNYVALPFSFTLF
jgi:hypothetical protein